MNTFKEQIIMEQKRIQRLIDLTDVPAGEDPSGSLILDPRGNGVYCYRQRYKNGKRLPKEYLGKPDSPLVRAFAAERFRTEQLSRLHSNQEVLRNLENNYLDYDRSSIIASLPDSFQAVLANSAFNDRYEELRQWANADYVRNPAPFPETENYAIDGTRTRSKGETIFYNIFFDLSVLFRFDCIIEVVDEYGRTHLLSPDFLIKCFDGTMIAIEHLGWSTGLKYGIDFGTKCFYYLKEGYILGKNFFVTSDDKHGGTDSAAIHEIALRVHRMFFGY